MNVCEHCGGEEFSFLHRERCRPERLRKAVRACIDKGLLKRGKRTGVAAELARHFHVTPQRVSQIVREEEAVRT